MDEKTLLFINGHIIKATFLSLRYIRSQKIKNLNETKVSFSHCCLERKPSKNSFLPYTINEWKKLDTEIRRIDSYIGFRKKNIKFC